eukprot:SAG31_NODE_35808_length_319_cov_1.236364_1_plen_37_part_10
MSCDLSPPLALLWKHYRPLPPPTFGGYLYPLLLRAYC